VQELYSLTCLAFDLADKYRNPVIILGDAMLGQMKEPLVRKRPSSLDPSPKAWAVSGRKGRCANVIKSLYLGEGELEAHIWDLKRKYDRIRREAVLCETQEIEDADLILVAFGTAARISKSSVRAARRLGLRVGLIRPITLFPFPEEVIRRASGQTKRFLAVELNTGQMVEDVRLAVRDGAEVHFYGRPCGAGSLPKPNEILEKIKTLCGHPAEKQEIGRGTLRETRV
jgi:2-oxoglutarate ferredoxin oxidoreductase subunit alpha